MQRHLSYLVALGLSLSACNSLQNKTPSPDFHTQLGPAWRLTFAVDCGSDSPDECIAGHGFSVLGDGRFEQGPGPQGQVRSGSLSLEEFKELEALVLPILVQRGEDVRETLGTASIAQNLTLTAREGAPRVIARIDGGELVHQLSTAADAQALLQLMGSLAERYYSLPFPDACLESAAALEGLFASVSGCSTDADCAYIDTNLSIIRPEVMTYLQTDRCEVYRPLVVGNAAAVESAHAKLIDAVQQTREICGTRIQRADCTQFPTIHTSYSPVCFQGACRVGG